MDAAAFSHDYQLTFGGAARPIGFRARNIVQALVRAEDLVGPGRSGLLLEDGLPVARVWRERFLVFPNHCLPVSGF
jgi:hypothetical protein